MKKRNIRQITAILALMELISGNSFIDKAHAMGTKQYYIINDLGKAEMVDNFDIILHKNRTVVELGEEISIFNDKNLYSRQYGGNQEAFEKSFPSLIKDPVIWGLLQEYFPESDFITPEVAMDFYRIYFKEITKAGCGYVAVANKIFNFFKNREDEFEKVFGYPMYSINENNVIDFNYEYLILDFANYSISSLGKLDEVRNMCNKTLAGIDLKRYEYSEEYKSKPKLDHNLTLDEVRLISSINDKYQELKDRYNKAIDNDVNISLPLNKNLGNLKDFLNKHGLNVTISLVDNKNRKYNSDDIIASESFTVYKEDDGEIYSQSDNVGAHYMYVVDANDEKIIVSSWGEKYVFDDSEADWVKNIDIKIKGIGSRGL